MCGADKPRNIIGANLGFKPTINVMWMPRDTTLDSTKNLDAWVTIAPPDKIEAIWPCYMIWSSEMVQNFHCIRIVFLKSMFCLNSKSDICHPTWLNGHHVNKILSQINFYQNNLYCVEISITQAIWQISWNHQWPRLHFQYGFHGNLTKQRTEMTSIDLKDPTEGLSKQNINFLPLDVPKRW